MQPVTQLHLPLPKAFLTNDFFELEDEAKRGAKMWTVKNQMPWPGEAVS